MSKLHHIGIACRSIERAKMAWELALGESVGPVIEVPEEGVRIAFIKTGEAKVELLEPMDDEGPIARFLEKRGEGIHHVAFSVPDVAASLERLKAQGLRVLDDAPRERGGNRSIIFVHPKSLNGVLTELVEYVSAEAEAEGY
jgi:methylmalonyl-CoA epimerase